MKTIVTNTIREKGYCPDVKRYYVKYFTHINEGTENIRRTNEQYSDTEEGLEDIIKKLLYENTPVGTKVYSKDFDAVGIVTKLDGNIYVVGDFGTVSFYPAQWQHYDLWSRLIGSFNHPLNTNRLNIKK